METREEKLKRIISESNNPEYAIELAIALFNCFLKETAYTQSHGPAPRLTSD
jgi:hypothetical protein